MACLRKLQAIVRERSIPPKKRVATKPTKGSVERRLKAKRGKAQIKATRRRVGLDD
jgi:ribosome-associated protein